MNEEPTQKTTQKTSTRDMILALLRDNPNLTRSEMAKLLGKSQNTIKGHLAELKSEGWWNESEVTVKAIGK
jgi:predicted ArsR family transcriptional regulator